MSFEKTKKVLKGAAIAALGASAVPTGIAIKHAFEAMPSISDPDRAKRNKKIEGQIKNGSREESAAKTEKAQASSAAEAARMAEVTTVPAPNINQTPPQIVTPSGPIAPGTIPTPKAAPVTPRIITVPIPEAPETITVPAPPKSLRTETVPAPVTPNQQQTVPAPSAPFPEKNPSGQTVREKELEQKLDQEKSDRLKIQADRDAMKKAIEEETKARADAAKKKGITEEPSLQKSPQATTEEELAEIRRLLHKKKHEDGN